ncbi:uncharacterized protein N7483_008665 [Penicillium malachiteum]|uniref:uncharacterized protein n=1 Tax=Penicillium malachiteum TaxID=1324776 RepID=UPI002548D755|nr:uncharacterized protein N7483_008665 [Penicillium malachiteum]KAJ5720731.1 hypothetical protein N7483_008665 [Penicillium malachiteum]
MDSLDELLVKGLPSLNLQGDRVPYGGHQEWMSCVVFVGMRNELASLRKVEVGKDHDVDVDFDGD